MNPLKLTPLILAASITNPGCGHPATRGQDNQQQSAVKAEHKSIDGNRSIPLSDSEAQELRDLLKLMIDTQEAASAANDRSKQSLDLYLAAKAHDQVENSAESRRLFEVERVKSTASTREHGALVGRLIDLQIEWLKATDQLIIRYGVTHEGYYVDSDKGVIMPRFKGEKQ